MASVTVATFPWVGISPASRRSRRSGLRPVPLATSRADSLAHRPTLAVHTARLYSEAHCEVLGLRGGKVTEVMQPASAAAPLHHGGMNGSPQPRSRPEPPGPGPRWHDAAGGWRRLRWLACGLAGAVAIVWYILLSPGPSGSKAEWFFGAVVFGVVLVAIWQTVTIQRYAMQTATEAAERLRKEFVAAEERSAREVAITRRLHQTEMEAQQTLHRAELEAQRELARAERSHLLERLQKQAMIEVSRAVAAHTQMLATLWNEAARVLPIEDAGERQLAMSPVFDQIGQIVNGFSVEVGNAHLLIEDPNLHAALDRINEAAVMAVRVAEEIHEAVLEGHAPEPNPVPSVQRLMHARAADARRLAWELLRTGLDGSRGRY